ncbi:MAG TPA: hypothetical protein VF157_16155 [Chloroflexota bacterium]
MKTPLIKGTLAALSLAGVLTAPALAQTTSTSPTTSPGPTVAHDRRRCPDGFDAGDAAGIRICRGKEGEWRLMTTDPAKSGAHEYTGTLTTNGKFDDVQLIRPENDDAASLDGQGNLVFDFKTYSGIDGVSFRVGGGANEVTFNLMLDDQQLAPSHIWIGDNGRHPKSDPFALHGHRAKPSPSASAQ